jgi:hypothetical protein
MELDFTSHIYPPDSILRAVHLVVLHGYSNWKLLKLLGLEFANSIHFVERTRAFDRVAFANAIYGLASLICHVGILLAVSGGLAGYPPREFSVKAFCFGVFLDNLCCVSQHHPRELL